MNIQEPLRRSKRINAALDPDLNVLPTPDNLDLNAPPPPDKLDQDGTSYQNRSLDGQPTQDRYATVPKPIVVVAIDDDDDDDVIISSPRAFAEAKQNPKRCEGCVIVSEVVDVESAEMFRVKRIRVHAQNRDLSKSKESSNTVFEQKTMSTFREWMYKRKDERTRNYRPEFVQGLRSFLRWSFSNRGNAIEGKILCPCKRCSNMKWMDDQQVSEHVLRYGFVDSYHVWLYHGETMDDYGYEVPRAETGESSSGAGAWDADTEEGFTDAPTMQIIEDLFPHVNMNGPAYDGSEEPNSDAKKFYKMYALAQKELYPGNSVTVLEWASSIMASKTTGRSSEYVANLSIGDCIRTAPDEYKHLIPKNFQAVKSIMMKLGLSVITYDVCENFCFLYYKEGEHLDKCPTCGMARYKDIPNEDGSFVPRKKIWYFPISERLQRLYMSRTTAEHMTWHANCQRRSERVVHPAGGEAWANFDETFPDFASEIRNVRLCLSSDGFDPKHGGRSHSVWPVFLTPYNLPPHLAMRPEFIFLSILIPGPKSPTVNIDVCMRPMKDELLNLWSCGVLTYDCFRKQNFHMRAAILTTTSDFPAYGMLSGWSTHGKFACPLCMQNHDTIRLTHGGKMSWFDFHRKFLPEGHPERYNTVDYRKNVMVLEKCPERMSREQVYAQVSRLPHNILFGAKYKDLPGKGLYHNWTKRSIFYDLPYWPYLLIRHNIDVMHQERNFFENIKLTKFDEGKISRDSLNARKDLEVWTNRSELFLAHPDAKSKPPSTYTLSKEKQEAFCEWLQTLKFPDGHSGNLGGSVKIGSCSISDMKSHDCHVFMQRLLPIGLRGLVPDNVWEALTEVSNFYRAICASEISVTEMEALQESVVFTLCKLEKIYPPAFFDSMEHLMVHLPYEAKVLGPVFYRWMYPFERMMWLLKNHNMNMNHMEGSIVQSYLHREVSNFTAFYFGKDVKTPTTRVKRNDRPLSAPLFPGQLSICVPIGKSIGKGKAVRMGDADFNAAILYIIRNCPEFDHYITMFDAQYVGPDLEMGRVNDLIDWLKNSHRAYALIQDARLVLLLFGGNRRALSYKGYNCNGIRWHTEKHGESRKTMCSGVEVKASGIVYYGMLTDIFEIDFECPGWPKQSIVLFKCYWFDHVRGCNRHPKYGIVEIDSRRRHVTRECFVLGSQASQVYYAPYACSFLPARRRTRTGWWVVCPARPRHVIDLSSVDGSNEEADTEYYEDPNPPPVNTLVDDLAGFNVRHQLVDTTTGEVVNSDDDGEDEYPTYEDADIIDSEDEDYVEGDE